MISRLKMIIEQHYYHKTIIRKISNILNCKFHIDAAQLSDIKRKFSIISHKRQKLEFIDSSVVIISHDW